MASAICVTIVVPNGNIIQQKNQLFDLNTSGLPISDQFNAVRALINVLEGALSGSLSAQVQITVRDTDPGTTTHGTGSVQATYNLK